MPSTAYFGASVINHGPLTTTFTAPASCATNTQHIVYAVASDITQGGEAPSCTAGSYESCLPSGGAVDKLVSAQQSVLGQGLLELYSPGLACPSGWTTAGLAAPTVNASLSLSGIFTVSSSVPTRGSARARPMPALSKYLGALSPDETLAACCPRYETCLQHHLSASRQH
jgi:hypothetical protein